MSWQYVWEMKGQEPTDDPRILNGYEHINVDTKTMVEEIKRIINIQPGDRVLEVGCGAGLLSQYLECDYVGLDNSRSLVSKHIKLFNNSVLHGEASDLPFKDNSFDVTFAFSVFQYFPDYAYADKAIGEMARVARRAVFIGDVYAESYQAKMDKYKYDTPTKHLKFNPTYFGTGWTHSKGFYDPHKYNVLKCL